MAIDPAAWRGRIRVLSLAALVLLVPLSVGTLLKLGRAVHGQKQAAMSLGCRENLMQLGVAMRQYSVDADGHLPPPERWGDCLLERVGSDTVFSCPADPARARTSYALNAAAARGRLDALLDPPGVPLLYDSARRMWNARDPLPELCNPPRHTVRSEDGRSRVLANNVLFADGSVRLCGPYDALGEAAWPESASPDEPDVEQCPPFVGASLLFVGPAALGLRTEYPAGWRAVREGASVTFAPEGGAGERVTLRRAEDVPASPTEGLPPEAQIVRRFRVDVSVRGDWPVVAEGVEVSAGGLRKARVVVPVEPRLLVVLAAPEGQWNGLEPALYLPLASLQLEGRASATPESETGP